MSRGTQTIETERLVLRRFTLDDAEAMYHTWATDPEVSRWMRWDPHKNLEETRGVVRQWLADYEKPGTYHWAITLKGGTPSASGTLIGSLGILNQPDTGCGREPGYCIGQAFWGKGYTTEALAAALDYYIKDTGSTDLHCCHAAENPASGRVMQKCGFVYDHDGSYTRYDGTTAEAKFYAYRPENGAAGNKPKT